MKNLRILRGFQGSSKKRTVFNSPSNKTTVRKCKCFRYLCKSQGMAHKKCGEQYSRLQMPIKILALIPMSLNSDQFRINAMILIGIDRHWALIEGVLNIAPI